MKILWVGDAIQPSGFARVTHAVCDRLVAQGHDVAVLGINYKGDPPEWEGKPVPFRVYPAAVQQAHDALGFTRLADIVNRERPDLVLCLNDSWVVRSYAMVLEPLRKALDFRLVGYCPIDSRGLYPIIAEELQRFDCVITYTKFGENVLRTAGYAGPLDIVAHGVDTETFYREDKALARKRFGIPEDAFVVFNGNRNQTRKRIDLTIRAFGHFAAKFPDDSAPLLYLHCGLKDLGWDIAPLFHTVMREVGAPNARFACNPRVKGTPRVSVADLRAIYNTADVSVNTCEGEGWGLVAFETAACGVAQVVPAHSSCQELWEDNGLLIPVKMWVDDPNHGLVRGLINPDALGDILARLYRKPGYVKDLGKKAETWARDPRFSWDAIAKEFEAIFERVLTEPKSEYVPQYSAPMRAPTLPPLSKESIVNA